MKYTVLKVDMLNGSAVVGNKEDGTMETYSLNAFNYTPNVGDLVSVYHDGNETMIVLEEEKKENVEVRYVEPDVPGYKVNRVAYALLAIFLGELGIHHYYAGNMKRGNKYLLLTLFLGWTIIVPIVIFVKCVIQAVQVLGMPSDSQGNVVIYR